MSTVPGFPDATVPTPETALLWATEGSGVGRDKKVTALNLVKDMFPGSIASGSAPSIPLDGTETVPMLQGAAFREATVGNVFSGGFALGLPALPVSTLPEESDIMGLVKLPGAGDLPKKMTLGNVFFRQNVNLNLINLVKYNNGADILASAVNAAGASSLQIAMIGPRLALVDLHLELNGQTLSASNTNPAIVSINWSGLPGRLAGVGLPYLVGSPKGTAILYHNSAFSQPIFSMGLTSDYYFYTTGTARKWQDLAPTNSSALQIHLQHFCIL
jgi:hypothetical protein